MAKKHGHIIDSWKTSGVGIKTHIPTYHVIKSSKYGIFEGSVTPCKQDYENINDWDGYRFAERKCDIEIVHAKAKILRERAKGILNLYKTLYTKYMATEQYKLADDVLADIYYQYKLAQKEYEKAYQQYKYMKESFSDYTTRMIKRRLEVQEKVKKTHSQPSS